MTDEYGFMVFNSDEAEKEFMELPDSIKTSMAILISQSIARMQQKVENDLNNEIEKHD